MILAPQNLRGRAIRAVLGFMAIFVLLLASGPVAGASSGPGAFFTYQQAVGSGFSGPCGTAVDKAGDVFVADFGAKAIYEIVAVNGAVSATSTVNQIASSFSFNAPCDVKLDASGNLFVADPDSGNVYEITATNGVVSSSSSVTTIDSFSYPSGLAFDARGNLFVADWSGVAVYEIPATNGSIVASTTPVALPTPTAAQNGTSAPGWIAPWSVATDASGDVYVTDYSGHAVYEIVAVSGSISSTSAVNPVGSGFSNPTGVVVDGQGNVFVADNGNGTLNVISQDKGTVSASSEVMTLVSGLGTSSGPYGLSLDGNGNIYLADYAQGAVYEISVRSLNLGTVAVGSRSSVFPMTINAAPGGVLSGWSVLNGVEGGSAFAEVSGTTCVKGKTYTNGESCTINVRFTPSQPGTYSGELVLYGSGGSSFLWVNLTGTGTAPQISFMPGTLSAPLTSTPFKYPDSIVVDGSGNVYVADPNYNSICKIAAGSASCTWLGSFDTPDGVAIDGAGNLYVVDSGNTALYELTPYGGGYNQRLLYGDFAYPTGIAADGSGNVYVADNGAGAIVKLSAYYNNEFWLTIIAEGLVRPWAVAVDGSGNVYVAGNSPTFSGAADGSVYMLTPQGSGYAVSTLGSGWVDPNGIAVDAAGAVIVADDDDGNGNGYVAILHQKNVAGVTTWKQDTWLSSSTVISPEGVGLDQKGNLYVVDGINGTQNAYKYDTADAPSLIHAPATIGITAPTNQQVNVINTGNAELDISAVGFPAAFPEDSSNGGECAAGATIDFPGSCALTIDFHPMGVGTNSGVVWLKDNALNATAAQQNIYMSGTGTATAAVLSSPAAGVVLASSAQTFNWAPVDGATGYTLWLGSSAGAGNLFNGHTTGTTLTTQSLPINGETIYARLYTSFNSIAVHSDSTFTAASGATLTSPTPGATLTGPSVTFGWTSATGASGYTLWLGSTGVGSGNLYNGHTTTGTTLTATNLPVNGKTIYARLYTTINGVTTYTDSTFTAASGAALTSPTPGSTFTSSSVTFNWPPVAGASGYTLWLGSTPGSGNLYDGHTTTGSTLTANNLPVNGETIYARLYTTVNGATTYTDSTYTAK
jgi:sugar lactone lactonase YvrE